MIGIANRCITDAKLEDGRRNGRGVEEFASVEDDFAGALAAWADVRTAVARLDERDRETGRTPRT